MVDGRRIPHPRCCYEKQVHRTDQAGDAGWHDERRCRPAKSLPLVARGHDSSQQTLWRVKMDLSEKKTSVDAH